MKNKIKLIQVKCERCNKPITTTNRSLYGADELKAKFGKLCNNCATDEEKHQINYEIGLFINKIGVSGE